MKLITCPNTVPSNQPNQTRTVFVAGGISNCTNWQLEMVELLSNADDHLLLINPRRDSFDISNASQSEFQIEWEHKHIVASDAMLFWFPQETLCPITLYELGVAAATNKPIFVGCHLNYARRFDVRKQLSLVRPEIDVRNNLIDVADDVMSWFATQQ